MSLPCLLCCCDVWSEHTERHETCPAASPVKGRVHASLLTVRTDFLSGVRSSQGGFHHKLIRQQRFSHRTGNFSWDQFSIKTGIYRSEVFSVCRAVRSVRKLRWDDMQQGHELASAPTSGIRGCRVGNKQQPLWELVAATGKPVFWAARQPPFGD